MRTWIRLAALPVGLAAAAFLFIAARGEAVTTIGDVTGAYGGSASFRFQPLTPLTAVSRGREIATMQVTQTDTSVTINLTLNTVEGPKLFALAGSYGQNNFFAVGNSPDGHMVLTGKVTGKSPKLTIKADAKLVAAGGITSLKFTQHETPPQ